MQNPPSTWSGGQYPANSMMVPPMMMIPPPPPLFPSAPVGCK